MNGFDYLCLDCLNCFDRHELLIVLFCFVWIVLIFLDCFKCFDGFVLTVVLVRKHFIEVHPLLFT